MAKAGVAPAQHGADARPNCALSQPQVLFVADVCATTLVTPRGTDMVT